MSLSSLPWKIIAAALIVAVVVPVTYFYSTPKTAQADANVHIRQEINIIDAPLTAASGSYATSSAIVLAAASSTYVGNTAYFEIVASTSAATNATVYLRNATSSASSTMITYQGTAYARYRSPSFTLSDVATEYTVSVGGEAVGKSIIAARIIILQSAATLSSTETQIEIGNQETYSSSATSTFVAPKYWYYDSAAWSDSPDFYAEVTYKAINGIIASTSVYKTAGTYTVILPGGTASSSIGLWGGGGTGGGTTNANEGGDGGAGGAFASSTLAATTSSHTLVIAATTAGPGVALQGLRGATSTWDTSLMVAGGGNGGLAGVSTSASTTGDTIGCVGTVCNAGGAAGAGAGVYGGGGGGGADSLGTGNSATAAGVAGTARGYGGAGGTKTTSAGTGNTGNQAGGGGAGGWSSNGTDRNGGTGAAGRADIYNYVASTTIVLQEDNGSFGSWSDVAGTYMVTTGTVGGGNATRARSSTFTPTNGHHYRIAFKSHDNRQVLAIYNAKIVVDTAPVGATNTYDESNFSANTSLRGDGSCILEQSFTARGGKLDSVTFYMGKTGSPTGNAYAELVDSTGTPGTDAKGTGSQLATSSPLDVSTLSSTKAMTTLSFTGASRYQLVAGHTYEITLAYRSGDVSNSVSMGLDTTSPTDPGNYSLKSCITGTSIPNSGGDAIYIVYETGAAALSKIEPQYLLANTKPAAVAQDVFLSPFTVNGDIYNVNWTAQTFTTTNAYSISRVDLPIRAFGAPTTTVNVSILATDGAGKPTGAALATGSFNASILGTVNNTVVPIRLTTVASLAASTKYAIVLKCVDCYNTNDVEWGRDGGGGYANGTELTSINSGSTWSADATDALFATYSGSTTAQNFLQSFDTTEWSTTNNYIHGVSADDNSTSVVEVDNTTGPTQISGSVVTSPDNYATSTGMCLTTSATLDTVPTTNSNDIFGDSIIVQVGVTSTCFVPAVAAPYGERVIFFE